jgi:hypothetical protein
MGGAIRMIRTITCLLAGFAMLAGMSLPGHANTHGCACLHNETGLPVNFRYRFGSGDWKKVRLKANWNDAICWRYDRGRRSSPELKFEIDVDMTKGNAWTTYALTRVQSPGNTCNVVPPNGHYAVRFRPNTNKQFIQVFKR